MKIVHVIASLDDGGAEGALYRVCTNDPRNEHIVISLAGNGKYGPMLQQAGLQVYALGMSPGRPNVLRLGVLWKILRQLKPDVVQSWMYHADLLAGLISRLAGIKNVIWGIRIANLHSGAVKRSTIAIAKLCAWLSPVVPAAIACCSERAKEMHTHFGYTESKFRVIPNGYNLSALQPDASQRQNLVNTLSIPPNVPILGMVARFHAQKDHGNLLAALDTVRQKGIPFHCVLVGTGMDNANEQLRGLVTRHGLDDCVSLLGPRSDIPRIMNAIDLHVLSSLDEAFPNVLAEAMACGTPCVTCDVGDAAYIVSDTGWVVPSQNSTALATAIEAAIRSMDDAEAWHERCLRARDSVSKRFGIDQMVRSYDAMWREISS